jgi:hypothetical protein
MTLDLYDCKKIMDRDGIIFYFSGSISHQTMIEIGSMVKSTVGKESQNSQLTSKVFSIFVEQIQNILHYSSDSTQENNEENTSSMIIVGKNKDGYFVRGGNLIDNLRKKILEKKLSTIQNMDKEELKQFYKEQRRKDPDESSKGAGLGFIEMSRKASKPLEYEMTPVGNDQYFFSINVTI